MAQIRTHKDLKVFQVSYKAALDIYKLTKTFPREEIYSLTDQIRRSSRSVPANIAEAWRKRRYPKSFIAKLSDSETEAAETHRANASKLYLAMLIVNTSSFRQ
jgi:four helix bundle protein